MNRCVLIIKNKNILIEIDGDFYHCNPNTKHSEVLYETQSLTKKNDNYKNTLCSKTSFPIFLARPYVP